MATIMKSRIGQLLSPTKEKETDLHLKEQIQLLNRMLNSKEEDLKAKSTQHHLMCDFFREKEKQFEQQQAEKDAKIASLEASNAELQEELLIVQERLKEILYLQNKLDLYEDVINNSQEKIAELTTLVEASKLNDKKVHSDIHDKEAEIKSLKQRIHSLEMQLAEMSTKAKFVAKHNESNQQVSELDFYKHNYEQTKQQLDEITEMFIRISHAILRTDVDSIVGVTTSSITPELREKLQSLEKQTKQKDQVIEGLLDKIKLFEDMLIAKQKIIARYQDRFTSIEQELEEKNQESSTLQKHIEEAKQKLEFKEDDVIQLEKKTEMDLKAKSTQMESLYNQLERLSQEMQQKEESVNHLFETVKAAELELEEKESEFLALSDQLKSYKTKLRKRESELRHMEKEKTRLEGMVLQNDNLVYTYSGILKAKEEALRAKEELAYHFFDLIKQSDEKIKVRDDQVARMYEQFSDNSTSLVSNIIEDYQ